MQNGIEILRVMQYSSAKNGVEIVWRIVFVHHEKTDYFSDDEDFETAIEACEKAFGIMEGK